jgi:catechol 2,3-dioxygenase-like lactoylglutathione lyase family enzyme
VKIHHLALRVADLERSAAFYRDVLGLAELERNTDGAALRSIWLSAGDAVLMIETALRGSPGAAGSGHLLCFAVDDLEDWKRRLGAAGVAIEDQTGYTLYVSDPDGHRVGLTVYPAPAASPPH